MGATYLVQSLREVLCPVLVCNVPIRMMVFEELAFAI